MKLKLLAAPSLLAASMFTSTLAMAIDTELKIEGLIIAGSCGISAANGGHYDYGDIDYASLNRDSMTGVDGASMETKIDILCPGPMMVGVRIVDNREGTESGEAAPPGNGGLNGTRQFGVNKDQAGNNLGILGFRISSQEPPQINGADGVMLYSSDNGTSWGNMMGSSSFLWFDTTYMHSFASSGGGSPEPIISASWKMVAPLFITNRDNLDLSRMASIDGSATMEIFYL